MFKNMEDKEKNILSFQIDKLKWNDIEKRIINHYQLGRKIHNVDYIVEYGIKDCSICTENGTFCFELGVLNSGNGYFVTIYPGEILKNEDTKIERPKTLIKRAISFKKNNNWN